MHKVFIDTDVIIDLLAKRELFYDDAAKLFTVIDKKQIDAFTTPVVFSNIHYILSRLKNSSFALENMRKLRLLINILKVDEKIVDLALNSKIKDFEDAIQYYSTLENNINFIITRNKKDFTEKKVVPYTPKEYLDLFKNWLKFGILNFF